MQLKTDARRLLSPRNERGLVGDNASSLANKSTDAQTELTNLQNKDGKNEESPKKAAPSPIKHQ